MTVTDPREHRPDADDGVAGVAKEHRTVSRVIRILELTAASTHGTRLQEIATAIGAPKTSAHGLVKGLVAAGYLRETASGYRVGPAVGTLLGAVHPPAVDLVNPHLRRLRDVFDETTILSARIGMSVVYLDMVESSQVIRYAAPLRLRRPLYPTSTGKCFLAGMSPDRRDTVLRETLAPPDVAAARDELERVHRDGVAYNRGETVPDVSAAAASVRVAGQEPWAIAVIGPRYRVEPRLPEIAAEVRSTAGRIEHELR